MKTAQADSAKPRPPYTGAKYRVGRALAPPCSRSRGAGACFALEPIRHPHSEPPEMGFAGAETGVNSVSCSGAFSLSCTSDAELVTDATAGVAAGVPAILGPGVMPIND